MKDNGFQDSYIAECKQLYFASGTYYMTIHGNTIPHSIHRGTLQGDTLSPFLFTIFMETLLIWLAVGSWGYKLTYQPHKSTSTILTYNDHGYANDVSITDGDIQNLKTQKNAAPLQPIHRNPTRKHAMRSHRIPLGS